MSDKKVSFSGLSLDANKIDQIVSTRQVSCNMTSWTRLVIPYPTTHGQVFNTRSDVIRNLSTWIEKNCKGNFFIGKFWIPASNSVNDHQHFLTLRFEDNKDAVLFKLQDIEQIATQEHF